MRIIDLETINQAMDNETQFVLRCEEVFHDKVSSAAAAILSAGRDRRIVALTGPSGSGKTTTAMRLKGYGAGAIALACTGMSTAGVAKPLAKKTGLPVIDPVTAEGLMAYYECLSK